MKERQNVPLNFDERGLLPAVIQDTVSGQVLMLAYMNQESLRLTLETGETYFWSRSRQRLWRKGETSGHRQRVREVYYDCDADALLVQVEQTGVACHTGHPTCFYRSLSCIDPFPPLPSSSVLDAVSEVIEQRKVQKKEDSYICQLLEKGKNAVQKKLIEEAAEVIMSSAEEDPSGVVYEMADLYFHSLVLLGYWNISPQEVYAELARRFGKPGIRKAQKASKQEKKG